MRLWTTGERLAALRSYEILDTPREAAFEDVVEIARTLTGAPIAMVSFVDSDRQWFKAERGAGITETPLETSFCAFLVKADEDMLVIPDATADPRTAGMSIVVQDPAVRAYAGVALRSAEGAPLGTLCVLDIKPRGFSDMEMNSLQALARQVTAHLELRRAYRERSEAAAAARDAAVGHELAMQAARLGRWDHRPEEGERFYDARAREILGVGPDEHISAEAMLLRIRAEDRAAVRHALNRVTQPDRVGPFDVEFRVNDPATAELRWVSCIGRTLFEDGRCSRFFGVMEDVTVRKGAEEQRALLTAELDHRVKNILTLAQSVVDSTLRGAVDLAEARQMVAARMRALGAAHEVLLAQKWKASPVREIVDAAAGGLSLDPARMEIEGPPVRLGSRPALQLALTLHELVTNALKYGALSNDTGRVRLEWALSGGDGEHETFSFHWRERGGPPVCAPSSTGFGTRMIERATAAAFEGEVRLDYAPAGFGWSVTAPMSGLRDKDEG